MTHKLPMEHSPEQIAHFAREFVSTYIDDAEEMACERMFASMAQQDTKEATFWLAVIHEIRQITSASLN